MQWPLALEEEASAGCAADAGKMEEKEEDEKIAVLKEILVVLKKIQGSSEYGSVKLGYDEERNCWWADVVKMLKRQLETEQNTFESHLTLMKWQMRREKTGFKEMWKIEKFERPGKNVKPMKEYGVEWETWSTCFDEAWTRSWLCFMENLQ